MDIVRFGSLGTYSRKIEQIIEEFKKYAEEMTKTEKDVIAIPPEIT